MLVEQLLEQSTTNRLLSLERLSEKKTVVGDFEGSVTGTWVKLATDGTGLVRYKNKDYKTRVLGLYSIPAGTKVELSHASGVYYSKF